MDKKPEGYYSEQRKEMVEFLPRNAKKVLDAGCGEGLFGKLVKETTGAEVWGIELDEKAAATAGSILDKVMQGDIKEKISELPDNHFDAVYFNDVLEHLADT